MNSDSGSKPFIIPIAGGKGGVGKTFLAANIALALADLNKTTLAIDLDLGGSNLYSWLGIKNTYPGLGDFLFSGKKPFDEFIVKDFRKNLSYVPGDGQTAGLANIMHLHKLKILKTIISLKTEFMLLDLSAGTTFNTLDFFRMSLNGIVVTVPETTSMMNLLSFFKNFLLRVMFRKFKKNRGILEVLDAFRKQPIGKGSSRFSELAEKIDELDPDSGIIFRKICMSYVPRIIFNMGTDRDDLSFGNQLRSIVKKYMMIDVEFIGFVKWDADVRRAVNKGVPFMDQFPDSPTTVAIKKIAERLVKHGRNRIDNSFEKLYASLEEPEKP